MPVSDHDIHGAAHLLIAQYGDNAVATAREMVETIRRKGDTDGADTWPSGRWARRRQIADIDHDA